MGVQWCTMVNKAWVDGGGSVMLGMQGFRQALQVVAREQSGSPNPKPSLSLGPREGVAVLPTV